MKVVRVLGVVVGIGRVVEDGMVVVEGVEGKLEEGYECGVVGGDDGMKGVWWGIVRWRVILMGVLLGVGMMGGS